MFVLLHTYRVRHGCRTLREMIFALCAAREPYGVTISGPWLPERRCRPTSHSTPRAASVMILVVAAMSRVENGTPARMDEVRGGLGSVCSQKYPKGHGGGENPPPAPPGSTVLRLRASRRTAAVHSRAVPTFGCRCSARNSRRSDSLFFRALCAGTDPQPRRASGICTGLSGRRSRPSHGNTTPPQSSDTLIGTPPLRRETIQRRRLTDSTTRRPRVRQTEHRIQADTILAAVMPGSSFGRKEILPGRKPPKQIHDGPSVAALPGGSMPCIAGLLVVAYGTYRLFKHR